jgi:hypothetical protein
VSEGDNEAGGHALQNALAEDSTGSCRGFRTWLTAYPKPPSLSEHAPQLQALVRWTYGWPPILWVAGWSKPAPPLLSAEGALQGYSLEPLLFTLNLQPKQV